MAVLPEPGQGKVETTISLRVVEAKNLCCAHELKHSRDTYVSIALDQEEVFRTATVEKSLSPLYTEDYSFRVPRDFSRLSFYICEPGLHRDSQFGKVSILHDELKINGRREEQWYAIQHIDADSEVQGKIHVSLTVEGIEVTESEEKKTQQMLTVRVLEAEGLSGWCGNCNGCPDPYCQVAILPNTPALKSEVRKGTSRKKTTSPNFQDVFSFAFKDLKHLLNTIVRVTVWHDPLIGERSFLGQVNLSVGSITTPYWSHDDWYWLCSRPATPTQVSRPDIGSLRLKVDYARDVIYPLKIYDTLSQMLLEATMSSQLCDTAVFILGEVHRDWSCMGRSLVRIFLALDKIEALILALIKHEVEGTIDSNTLFRGNSLASKVIDEFMKFVGCSYLQCTLQGCIDEIFDVRRQCEVDPSRLTETDNRDVNMANLLFFVEKILSAILASARSCPQMMCRVFSMLKEAAMAKFPDKKDVVCYTSVSGFIFLRFFAPAILNPRLFHLRPECPSPVVARTLTLISKSIQSLGNIGGPKVTANVQHKEQFMTQLQVELSDHAEAVKAYLSAISNPRGGKQCSLADTVYREGWLIKRSQGRKKGPKNFRKRFFCLSGQSLTYSKSKGEAFLCTIPANDMLAVERVDESAFGMKFMFQLVQPERVLYMQARNSVEEVEWLTALSKVCVQDSPQVMFHSGAYGNTAWTCCGSSAVETSLGCKPISLAIKMLAQREDIDLERELHKVFKMLCNNQAKLIALKNEATVNARQGNNEQTTLPPRLKTLCELMVFVKNLELASTAHLQSQAHKHLPGSKDAPYRCSSGEALVIS